ncbi:MAG: ComEC/Rec2 family competence protein, partial [Bacteroidota bacterium]
IAAQLFTSPLGLYEFHCFPVYFLPANLIVVPLSTLIIYGSILVVFFSFIGPVGSFVCLLLSRLTDLLIGMEFFIGELPGAVIGSLHISAIECILLYLALFCFVFFLLTGKSSMILSATTILFIQHGFRIMDNVSLAESSQVIQWKSKQVKACTVIQSGYGVTLVDPERTNDTVWLKKKLPTSLDALRIPEKNRVVIFKKPAESLNNR